jgi:hypothetical protein
MIRDLAQQRLTQLGQLGTQTPLGHVRQHFRIAFTADHRFQHRTPGHPQDVGGSELAPPDQRTLPLPLPLFCVVLAVQFLVIYGLLALAGLRLARARNREPAPLLTAL